jgi:hypothetical protein
VGNSKIQISDSKLKTTNAAAFFEI